MSTFFLEGEKFEGKSTLLQEVLKDFPIILGFYVERIVDESGDIQAFELKNANDLNHKYSNQPKPEHWFIVRKPKPAWNLTVFETFGCQLLKNAQKSKNIILLDEIGGIELLVPDFTNYLKQVLAQDTKIIGVFKSEANYQAQKQNSKQTLAIDNERQVIHQEIRDYGELRTYTRNNHQKIKFELQQFLAE